MNAFPQDSQNKYFKAAENNGTYMLCITTDQALHIQNSSMSGPWPKEVQNSLSSFLSILYIKILKNALKKSNYPIPQFQSQFSPFYSFFHFHLQHV
jgi:hypothetical protein